MIRLVAVGALMGSASLYASPRNEEFQATSRLGLHMHSTHEHYDNAVVIFDLNANLKHPGTFTVAGEGHDHGHGDGGDGGRDGAISTAKPFPHLTILADHFEHISIIGNTLVFRAMGRMNNDPVTIQAIIKDGGPNGQGDSVWVEVSDMHDMESMTFWNGEIRSGDIKINRREP